jgi:hypothetical protein
VAKPPVTKPVTQPAGGGSLPTTGLPALLPWLAVAVGATGFTLLRRRRA